MTIDSCLQRRLGTMVAYGFAEIDLAADLTLARRPGAEVLEVFPVWRVLPDPRALRAQVEVRIRSLDAIDYRGPIVLECVRHFRKDPEGVTEAFIARLARLARMRSGLSRGYDTEGFSEL